MSQPQPLPGPDDPIRALAELGLTLTESRAYLTLLRLGSGTAAVLAEQAGVPRPKVYEALRGLEQRGFLSVSIPERVAEYVPVAPEAALTRWRRQRDNERQLQSEREQQIAERLVSELPAGPGSAEAAESYIEMVTGAAQTTEVLERLIGRASHRLWIIQQPPFVQPRSRWGLSEAKAAARNVDVRVLFLRDAVEDERRYRPLLDAGAAVRVSDEVPMKLLVRDSAEALVSLRDPLTGRQSLASAVVHHPDLVGPLELLFEREWDRSEPLTPSAAKKEQR